MGTPEFGPDFRFGVASADHQCEGFDPATPDIWDEWEKVRELTPRGRATAFETRYPEDIALAQQMGAKVFRFSISWSRIEPQAGQFSAEALAHYRRVVDAIVSAGMTPLVTLHHFVWPLHIEARGGMRAQEFPEWFAAYAGRVAQALGPTVLDWISFNEPNLLCFGYFRPWWQRNYAFPPGLPLDKGISEQLAAIAALIRNLFQAHTAARAAIRRQNPTARVGANPSVIGLPGWIQSFIDRRLTSARSLDQFKQRYQASRRRAVRSNHTDAVISSFSITPERSAKIDFTSAYLVAGLALLVRSTNLVDDPAEFVGRVGVLSGSTAEDSAEALMAQAKVASFQTHKGLMDGLTTNAIDGVLADDVQLLSWLGTGPQGYRLLNRRMTVESYGIATVRGSGMLDALEAALDAFRDSGQLAASIAAHLPGYVQMDGDEKAARRTVANLSEPAETQAHDPAFWRTYTASILSGKPLRIAVSTDVAGLGWRDPQSGEWSGLEIDIARHLAIFLTGDVRHLELIPVTVGKRMPTLDGFRAWLQRLLEPITILSAVVCTNWWHLGMAGRLPIFLCPSNCVGQQDFVGFDYYWGIGGLRLSNIKGLVSALTGGDFSQAPIWVGGLGWTLRYLRGDQPKLPIYVIENGSIGMVGKVPREAYVREHIAEAQREVARGVPLTTFIVWSVTTNREWNAKSEIDSDFGLYNIDLDGDPALTRTVTPAATMLRRIVKERTAI